MSIHSTIEGAPFDRTKFDRASEDKMMKEIRSFMRSLDAAFRQRYGLNYHGMASIFIGRNSEDYPPMTLRVITADAQVAVASLEITAADIIREVRGVDGMTEQ